MHQTSGPSMDPLPPDTNLLQPVIQRAEKEPDRVMAAYRDGDHFVDVTAGGFTNAAGLSPRASSPAGLSPVAGLPSCPGPGLVAAVDMRSSPLAV